MKTMRYFLAVGAALILAGCATTFRPWNLSEVQKGMGRDQVIQLLGEPDYIFLQDDAEHLRYTYQEDYSPSSMPIDIAYERSIDQKRQAMKVERSLQVLEYDVILVDGKVLNYKDVTK
jgi:outer membrane protein assembly factor BamE (lipoprotein component of BamABCDE complex)